MRHDTSGEEEEELWSQSQSRVMREFDIIVDGCAWRCIVDEKPMEMDGKWRKIVMEARRA